MNMIKFKPRHCQREVSHWWLKLKTQLLKIELDMKPAEVKLLEARNVVSKLDLASTSVEDDELEGWAKTGRLTVTDWIWFNGWRDVCSWRCTELINCSESLIAFFLSTWTVTIVASDWSFTFVTTHMHNMPDFVTNGVHFLDGSCTQTVWSVKSTTIGISRDIRQKTNPVYSLWNGFDMDIVV